MKKRRKYAVGGDINKWGVGVNLAGNAYQASAYDSSNLTDSEKQINNTGTEVVGAIPYGGELWAGLAKIGTTASSQIAGDRTNESKNAQAGIVNPFNQFENNRNTEDWISSFINPLGSNITKSKRIAREANNRKQIMNDRMVRNTIENSSSYLSVYPGQGVQGATFKKGGYMSAYGAELPSVEEGGDKTNISSDAAVYSGNTHENGGIDLDNDTEIEDNEVIQGNRVYSDRLKPNDITKSLTKDVGFNVSDKDTFASLSEKLLRKKGRYENHPGDPTSEITEKAMSERIDYTLDMIFQDQQSQNNESMGKKKYSSGGEYADGGIYIKPSHRGRFTAWASEHGMGVQEAASHVMANKDNYSSSVVKMANFAKNFGGKKALGGELDTLEDIQRKTEELKERERILQGQKLIAYENSTPKKVFPLTDEELRVNPGFIPSSISSNKFGRRYASGGYIDYGTIMNEDLKKPDTTPLTQFDSVRTPVSSDIVNSEYPITSPENPKNNYLGFLDNIDLSSVANTAGTLTNQSIINKMKVNTPERTIPLPRFSYTDMSSPILARNSRSYREAILGASRAGLDTPGAITSLFTSKLQNEGDIMSQEANRKQSAVDNYLNRVQGANSFNSQILSQNDFNNTQRYNERLGLTQGNNDNFIRGVLGNASRKDAVQLDKDRAIITQSTEGNRGITKRQLKSNPALKEAYTRMFGKEYVDNLLNN